MLPKIRLYGIVPFDRGAKARWLLTEMGIPFENHWLDREAKENESPAFLKINPMGRSPAMQIDDVAFFESGALCAYLADRFLDKGLAPALDAPERARYQQWMYFAATTLESFQARIMITEDIPNAELREAKEAPLREELDDACATMSLALAKGDYLLGNRLSAADICVGYQLSWCKLWPELLAIMEKHPRVLQYLDRLVKHPSAVEAKVFSYPG